MTPSPSEPRPHPPRWVVWIWLVALGFGTVAPTLRWLEFSGGMENLNIATALELRRDHAEHWLLPTLEGEPRIKKPPLTAWLTGHAMRPATVAQMSSTDPVVRHAAAERLAWESRWPSLLAACLMLVATYELGRAVADPVVGLVAALVAATTVIFLQFGRSAMVDVHLGLWVTVANVALAHAILHGRRWAGCVGAGAALGLAFMIKGPVAWVQTLLPAAGYLAFIWWRDYKGRRRIDVRPWLAPAMVGLLAMGAIGLPWFIYVYRTVPDAIDIWLHQATEDRGADRAGGPFDYAAFLPMMLPWLILFIGGVITARRGVALAAVMALLPLVAMSFYKDRKPRYIFPMTAPAAVVAASGLLTLAQKRDPRTKTEQFVIGQHWGLLVLAGVVLPAVAATTYVPALTTVTGEPWLTRAWGAGLTIALGLTLAGLMLVRKHWVAALVGATVVVTLTLQFVLIRGYAHTESGLSPMRPLAEAIWAEWPDAEMYNAHPKGKRASVDLSIYLNRPTRWVSTEALANLAPGVRPKVVVMLQNKGDAPPTPPEGWVYVHKVQRDKDWWWANALPPTGVR